MGQKERSAPREGVEGDEGKRKVVRNKLFQEGACTPALQQNTSFGPGAPEGREAEKSDGQAEFW